MSDKIDTEYSLQSVKPSVQTQLERLHKDLQTKYNSSVQNGLVDDLPPIKEALTKVQSALSDIKLKQKITNSQVRVGNYRNTNDPSETPSARGIEEISPTEARQIEAFNRVESIALIAGQKFTNMKTHSEYMKKNISGLFSLVNAKEIA